MRHATAAAALCAALAGCADYNDKDFPPQIQSVGDAGTSAADVYYVTDRNFFWTDAKPSVLIHGANWSTPSCGAISIEVVPHGAVKDGTPVYSSIGKPLAQIDQCEPPEPGDDNATNSVPFARFLDAVNMAAANRCVLLYVQGYNNTFDTTIIRAAQIQRDTQSSCLPLAFSWSSAGQVDRYVSDVEHSSYAVPLLHAVILGLRNRKLRLDVIAHSMGTRLTLQTLVNLRHECSAPLVNELVLAAADIGEEDGNNDFATLKGMSAGCFRRMTLYVSKNDSVLAASESVHGGIPRAGRDPRTAFTYQSAPGDVTSFAEGTVDVVDASAAPGDPLGHGYFAVSSEAMGDIGQVLRDMPSPARATLGCGPEGETGCDPQSLPNYRLRIAPDRRAEPGFLERLLRDIIPLQPGGL